MRHIFFGLLTIFAVGMVVDFLASANSTVGDFLSATGLGVLLAVFAGAIVARKNFLIPALAATAIIWLYTCYLLFTVGSAAEGVSLFQIMSDNVLGLAVYLAAATIGAISGMWLAPRMMDFSESANTATTKTD